MIRRCPVTTRRARSPRGSGEILAEEIIEAASDLLVEHDDETAVSIRAVANRVGVTPPSIYLHFADKDALLDAVCARYFEHLDAEMAVASEGIADPLENALAQGLAYVRFALATPVLYRVAFRRPPDSGERLKVDDVLAASAYARFRSTVAAMADEGICAAADIDNVVLELWAVAHGIASLMIAKPGLPWGRDLRHAENVLRSVGLGRATLTRLGERADHDTARAWFAARDVRSESSNDNMVKRR
ncbi:TetR/AcrR family transcriptional regulator [Gordonia sp. ABSL49_1]|uniref:TetR/AcrR family transcriptional regulator n=1 Tax=Gordonia sp. ABSL49_1 TaxID=2920941 RepID=UPI001F0E5F3E|nr:TetR/AcrR family transcriptional regulator [Gordonia sp. ABSL49_1]MCH5642076.1 TetR/AcrR family transcriptional regulator [Gordonia sp. ABSL49_1]